MGMLADVSKISGGLDALTGGFLIVVYLLSMAIVGLALRRAAAAGPCRIYPFELIFAVWFFDGALFGAVCFSLRSWLPEAWMPLGTPYSFLVGGVLFLLSAVIAHTQMLLRYRTRRRLLAGGTRCKPGAVELSRFFVPAALEPAEALWKPFLGKAVEDASDVELSKWCMPALVVLRAVGGVKLYAISYSYSVGLRTFLAREVMATRQAFGEIRDRLVVCYSGARPEHSCLAVTDSAF